MSDFKFRTATMQDAERIWTLMQQAKAQMYREGKQQWDESYPLPCHIEADIAKGYAHVLCLEDVVVAYGAVAFEGEPAYDVIDGEWLSVQPYVVVHRLAVADEVKRQGVATRFMQEVERLAMAYRSLTVPLIVPRLYPPGLYPLLAVRKHFHKAELNDRV